MNIKCVLTSLLITSYTFLWLSLNILPLTGRKKYCTSEKYNLKRVYLIRTSFCNGRWLSIVMGNSVPEQTMELLKIQRNISEMVFFSLTWPHSVLLEAGINYFKYSTRNKDYCLVYFAYPLNMSTLVIATLFSVIETRKHHIFLIWQIWNRRDLHNKLLRVGRILNELRRNFAKERSRKKAHKLKACSETVLNIHFSWIEWSTSPFSALSYVCVCANTHVQSCPVGS